jgi:hypothetical protein
MYRDQEHTEERTGEKRSQILGEAETGDLDTISKLLGFHMSGSSHLFLYVK